MLLKGLDELIYAHDTLLVRTAATSPPLTVLMVHSALLASGTTTITRRTFHER